MVGYGSRREILLTSDWRRVNEEVIIRLKWGQTEYKGRLVSIDSYMNIQLSGAEEWIDQQMTSVLGQVLIRCVSITEFIETFRTIWKQTLEGWIKANRF
jgi:small nuclear ribonucleoprotein (snRNP)-like protein